MTYETNLTPTQARARALGLRFDAWGHGGATTRYAAIPAFVLSRLVAAIETGILPPAEWRNLAAIEINIHREYGFAVRAFLAEQV